MKIFGKDFPTPPYGRTDVIPTIYRRGADLGFQRVFGRHRSARPLTIASGPKRARMASDARSAPSRTEA